jgi:hypothetical protein
MADASGSLTRRHGHVGAAGRKAGSVRFNRNAQSETHQVEYLGNSPTEFIRVELKTKPALRIGDARLKSDADFPVGGRPSPQTRA